MKSSWYICVCNLFLGHLSTCPPSGTSGHVCYESGISKRGWASVVLKNTWKWKKLDWDRMSVPIALRSATACVLGFVSICSLSRTSIYVQSFRYALFLKSVHVSCSFDHVSSFCVIILIHLSMYLVSHTCVLFPEQLLMCSVSDTLVHVSFFYINYFMCNISDTVLKVSFLELLSMCLLSDIFVCPYVSDVNFQEV